MQTDGSGSPPSTTGDHPLMDESNLCSRNRNSTNSNNLHTHANSRSNHDCCNCAICIRDLEGPKKVVWVPGDGSTLRCMKGGRCTEDSCLFNHPYHDPDFRVPTRSNVSRLWKNLVEPKNSKPLQPQILGPTPRLGNTKLLQHAISSFTHVVFGPGASVDRIVQLAKTTANPAIPLIYKLHPKPSGEMIKMDIGQPNVICVTWLSPHVTATLNYNNIKDAEATVAAYNNTIIAGRTIRVTIKSRLKLPRLSRSPTSVKIRGLPIDTSLSKWEDRGLPPLPLRSQKPRSAPVASLSPTKYNVERAFTRVRKAIDKASRVEPSNYKRKEPSGGALGVEVQYRSWDQARRVRDALVDRRPRYIGGKSFKITLEEPFLFRTSISKQQYRAQEKLITSIVEGSKGHPLARLEVATALQLDAVYIKVVGNNSNAVGALKVRIERLLAGEHLCLWDDFIGLEEATEFLSNVAESTGVHINVDKQFPLVRVYGEASAIKAAREALLTLPGKAGSRTLELDRWCLEAFVTNGIPILSEMVGSDNLSYNPEASPPTVTVKGGLDVQHILRVLIAKPPPIIEGEVPSEPLDLCPICFDSVSNPVALECGHSYCHSCLHHYLTTAADGDKFPLCCVGREGQCLTPLPIRILARFLSRSRLAQLFEASFELYLANNSDKYRHCRTPSCPQIYQVSEDRENAEIFVCSSCLHSTCTGCHGVEHQGVTCEAWRLDCNPSEQETLLKKWAEKHKGDVNHCPKCNILIEKAAGCAHMKCRCGAHICWHCMEVFPTSGQTYSHINNCRDRG